MIRKSLLVLLLTVSPAMAQSQKAAETGWWRVARESADCAAIYLVASVCYRAPDTVEGNQKAEDFRVSSSHALMTAVLAARNAKRPTGEIESHFDSAAALVKQEIGSDCENLPEKITMQRQEQCYRVLGDPNARYRELMSQPVRGK